MDQSQLDGLLALKIVAEKRNFTAAAAELGVSPSAVSQSIKQLESRLGIALLSRTTRSTGVTEAGERFLNQVAPALEQILTAIEDVGNFAAKPSGLLRLNLPKMMYPTYLEPIVASFMEKYPEISVELFFDDGQTDVVAKGFDAGIRLSDILAQDVVAIKLIGPVKFVVAGSPKYLNKKGRPKHPKELLSHNCLRVRFKNNFIYDKWEFETKGKIFQVQVHGSLIVNDSYINQDAAIKGQGLVYTTEEAIKDKIKAGKLEIVLESYSCESAGFYLYYPKKSQVLPKLRVFIEHLREYQKLPNKT